MAVFFIASLAVLALNLSTETLEDASWVLFGAALVATAIAVWRTRDHLLYFSPSAVMASYALASGFIGSLFFAKGWTLRTGFSGFGSIEHLNIAVSFLIAASAVAIAVLVFGSRRRLRVPIEGRQVERAEITAATLVLMAATVTSVSLTLLGGAGDVSSLVMILCGSIIVVGVAQLGPGLRAATYSAIALLLILTAFNDKRFAVLFVIGVSLYEVRSVRRIRLRARHVLVAMTVVTLVAISVFAMAIQRGYGNLGTETIPESVAAVPEYLTNPDALELALINLEFPATYYHTVNAIGRASSGTSELRFGSTYAKILFVPLPRAVFESKPKSFIGLYTEDVDPTFRAYGGSLPPNAFAEAFGNFHYLGGLIAIGIVFTFLNACFEALARLLREHPQSMITALGLAVYIMAWTFYRGFGLDGLTATLVTLTLVWILVRMLGWAIRSTRLMGFASERSRNP